MFFYVNNITILNRIQDNTEAEEFIRLLYKKYEMRKLGEMK